MMLRSIVLSALACVLTMVAHADEPADLVLRGGKLVTMDDRQSMAEALAVRGDRIVAVGTNEDIRPYVGASTRILDLNGQLAVPGFIDCHAHFLSLGESLAGLDLSQAKSWEQIVAIVAEASRQTPEGQWIVGRGWHQETWTEPPEPNVEGYPVHDALSRVTPKHPVLLTHGSGHMCIANQRAMQLAGVSETSKDIAGGEILRDAAGEPVGVFRENAMDAVHRAYQRSLQRRWPEEIEQEQLHAIRLATDHCLEHGVTSFQDAGSSLATIDRLKRLADRDELKVRLWVMINSSNQLLRDQLADYRIVGAGDHHLTVRAIKRFADGALGTHGAWMLQPYEDLPGSTGLNITPVEEIAETARIALEHDFQLCVHAIGDRANREVLDLYERHLGADMARRDLRWRIEHAQHLHLADIARFAPLGVIASMQGVHATSDGPFVVERLGYHRARTGAYAWQSLLETGAVVINGTDAPVERLDPIACFTASVTRRMADGKAFFPEQSMTRLQALRSYTRDAAWGAFEDHLKGSLSPGKLADIVVLSQDILTVADTQLPETEVVCTIVGGEVLYERP